MNKKYNKGTYTTEGKLLANILIKKLY